MRRTTRLGHNRKRRHKAEASLDVWRRTKLKSRGKGRTRSHNLLGDRRRSKKKGPKPDHPRLRFTDPSDGFGTSLGQALAEGTDWRTPCCNATFTFVAHVPKCDKCGEVCEIEELLKR